MSTSRVEKALAAFQSGSFVIMVDDESRENEGDLVLAAQFATPEKINFLLKEARGLVCLAMDAPMIAGLELPFMTTQNEAPYQTAFTVSIEAKEGVTTGISAQDRAHTIQTAIRVGAKRSDLVVPGHIFPLRALPGGVLVRAGHTEGSVDLAKLAGLTPASVICEVLNDDGTMARGPQLKVLAQKHGFPIVSIEELIDYRIHHDSSLVEEVASSKLPTKFGVDFELKVFRAKVSPAGDTGAEHVAMVLQKNPGAFLSDSVLVRVHSECLTGDVFGSLRCDCGSQLEKALSCIAAEGEGVLVYLRQEGRGIGLKNKIKAYELQDQGLDTVDANTALGLPVDMRQYGIGAQILRQLGISKMRILSNNPKKLAGLEGFGLSIVGRVPLEIPSQKFNENYLETKKSKLGHLIQGENS